MIEFVQEWNRLDQIREHLDKQETQEAYRLVTTRQQELKEIIEMFERSHIENRLKTCCHVD